MRIRRRDPPPTGPFGSRGPGRAVRCPPSPRGPAGLLVLGALAVALAGPGVARAGDACAVPGSHATIQEAADDLACTSIALADQTYPESVRIARSVSLTGPGAGIAVLEGRLEAVGVSTVLTVTDLRVESGCRPVAVEALAGARIEGVRLDTVSSSASPCPAFAFEIFADGFESGDTTAWE